MGDGGEGGQDAVDGGAAEGLGGGGKEAVGGLVGEQDVAVAVSAEDGDGAGLDEVLKLLFEATTDAHLGLDLLQVGGGDQAAAVGLVDEGADAGEGGEVEHVTGKASAEGPGIAVEELGEEHA